MWLFLMHDFASRRIAQEESPAQSDVHVRIAKVLWPDTSHCTNCKSADGLVDITDLTESVEIMLWNATSVTRYLDEAYWAKDWESRKQPRILIRGKTSDSGGEQTSIEEQFGDFFHSINVIYPPHLSRSIAALLACVFFMSITIAASEVVAIISGKSLWVRIFGQMKHSASKNFQASENDTDDHEDNRWRQVGAGISKRERR